MLDLTERVSKH